MNSFEIDSRSIVIKVLTFFYCNGCMLLASYHRNHRLPQLFISKGIFEFSINNNDKERILEDVIMKQKAINSHSELEICLRSGSIVAAEDLRRKLADLSQNIYYNSNMIHRPDEE